MANAYAALAAGRLNKPYVVRALRRGDEVIDARPPAGRPLNLSPATRKDLIRLLEGVVEQGTGEPATVSGFRVAGKTGTAQKSSRSGYSATGRLASFVGVVPAGAPRLVGLVMIDEPRDVTGGGVVAGPIFAEVMETALLYLGIAPDRDVWERRTDFLALRRSGPAPAESDEEATSTRHTSSKRPARDAAPRRQKPSPDQPKEPRRRTGGTRGSPAASDGRESPQAPYRAKTTPRQDRPRPGGCLYRRRYIWRPPGCHLAVSLCVSSR